MKIFIHDNGFCMVQDTHLSEWYHKQNGYVTFKGVKINGASFAQTDAGFVRVSIPEEKQHAFENVASSLFRNLRKIGKYDSGNIGYEFNAINAPDIEIKFS